MMERVLDRQLSDFGGFILELQEYVEMPIEIYEVNPRRLSVVKAETRMAIVKAERRIVNG